METPIKILLNRFVSLVSRTYTTILFTCPDSTLSSVSAKHFTCKGEWGNTANLKKSTYIGLKVRNNYHYIAKYLFLLINKQGRPSRLDGQCTM